MALDASKSTIFWYHMKRSFIYLLVPVLSLGIIRLCINVICEYYLCWDHGWIKVDRRLCRSMLDYQHYFPLLPITLTVAWQLLLVPCNVKVIQLPFCNSSCKVAHGSLHKWLCWELRVSSIVFVLLFTLDVCLTYCGTILYLTNRTF